MQGAMYGSLFFTVALLVTTAYFLMGGLPLLILKHDVALDARFVRGFFSVYCKASFWAALGACVSYALWGRWVFAVGAAVYVGIAIGVRKALLPAMHALGAQIEASAGGAILKFRRLHVAVLSLNLVQLAVLVWSITRLSL